LGLAKRLGFLASSEFEDLVVSYSTLVRGLQAPVASLDNGSEARSPRPEA